MAKFDSFAQGTPSWIEHSSPDPAASKAFYGPLFNWDFDDQPMGDSPEAGVYSVAQIEGDQVAGIGPQFADAQGAPASWGVYLAADNVDEAVARAKEAGGRVLAEPMDLDEDGRIAWVADPQGAAVGLWQASGGRGSVRANEPGTNIWNELVTPDINGVAAFYEATVGLKAAASEQMPDYVTLQANGETIGGTMAPQMEGVPNHWNVYFNVASVDDSVAKATELGAQTIAPAFDVPGVGRMAVLADPQGGMFNLMQNPDS